MSRQITGAIVRTIPGAAGTQFHVSVAGVGFDVHRESEGVVEKIGHCGTEDEAVKMAESQNAPVVAPEPEPEPERESEPEPKAKAKESRGSDSSEG